MPSNSSIHLTLYFTSHFSRQAEKAALSQQVKAKQEK